MSHVLITGGSRGIGAAMVRAFARAGYTVSFTYLHHQEAALALARETGATPCRADNASEGEVLAALATLTAQNGGVDVLINNAGIAAFGLLGDTTTEAWHRMMGVHLDGAFFYTRGVLPHMIRQKAGRILNISSMWGQVGASCEVPYSTAKAGLIGLTRALAKEVGPSGITVNCIAPGLIDTEMNAALSPSDLDALCEEIPLGRLGTAEEVAALALFLSGEGGSYITGQVIAPNGGMVI